MEFFSDMLSLQLMLFVLILVGVLLRRIGLLTESGCRTLSSLLINVILPCNTVRAFMSGADKGADFARNCLLMVGISALIQIITAVGNRFLFARFPREKRSVLSYGMICSNSSFVGLPIAEGLFGGIGAMYTSVFQIPLRFIMWTSGLSLFTDISHKDALKKLACHPCVIAVFAGLLLMVLPVELPDFLTSSISALSSCTTPVSMLVIGSILALVPIRGLFSLPVLYFTALRLMVFPLLVYVLLLPFHLNRLLVDICVLMTAMPAGSTTSILANQYDCDAVFASEIVFTSTLFSIVTIPLLSLLF